MRIRASRWVIEPILLAGPFLASVVMIAFLILYLDPGSVLSALLLSLVLAAALVFLGARWTRGKIR